MQEMKLVTELREVGKASLQRYMDAHWNSYGCVEALARIAGGYVPGAGGAATAQLLEDVLAHLQANYVEVETDYHPTWISGSPAWYGCQDGRIGTLQTIVVPKLPAKKTKDELLAEAATLLKQHGAEGRKLAEEIERA